MSYKDYLSRSFGSQFLSADEALDGIRHCPGRLNLFLFLPFCVILLPLGIFSGPDDVVRHLGAGNEEVRPVRNGGRVGLFDSVALLPSVCRMRTALNAQLLSPKLSCKR
jgi:hypothetical protein